MLQGQALATAKSSSIVISPDGLTLAVVNSDSRSVSLVSLPGGVKSTEIFVGRSPQTAAFGPDGVRLYVTDRLDDTVSVIDVSAETRVDTISVCDEPFGSIAMPDGRVIISCTGAGQVAVIDASSGTVTQTIITEVHPRALALSPDASELYVTHFSTGRVSVIDPGSFEIEAVISTGADSNLSTSITLSPDGTQAWVPQTRSNVTNPALLFDTTVFPVVSSIDLEARAHQPSERIFLDISDQPVNMPFDTVQTPDNRLWVLNAGSNDLSVIDLADDSGVAHLEVGENPRAMVLTADGGTLYVDNALSGSVSVVDTVALQVTGEIPVTNIPLSPSLLNGKRLFHSSNRADLARDQWISCATCHFEEEMDGRTWNFPDGPRNTTSLLGIADTLPVHWSGDLDELQDVEATIRDIQAGTGLTDGSGNCLPACDQADPNAGRSQDLDDLAAFMASLDLSPNPNLEADGSMSEAAERGKAVFESVETGCAECHVAPVYSDALKHDVGTGAESGEKKGTSFDTPTLRGIYKTAPYLHHGAAETLLDVLTAQNPGDLHGKTSHLQESELQDLVTFMESIGTARAFAVNAGLNDAWVNADAPFQGLFITVFPESKLVFVAWFSFDTEIPGGAAVFGAADQRWVTALGTYDGEQATLTAELTTGGIFNGADPRAVQQADYGTIGIEFTNCRSGVVRFDFPSLNLSGEFAITRVLDSNIGLCDSLNDELLGSG